MDSLLWSAAIGCGLVVMGPSLWARLLKVGQCRSVVKGRLL